MFSQDSCLMHSVSVFLTGDEFRTPEKGYDFSKFVNSDSKEGSARRKLILKRRGSGDGETPVLKLNVDEVSKSEFRFAYFEDGMV